MADDAFDPYGLQGEIAPPWNVAQWVDGHGHPTAPIELRHSTDRWRILFCFQSWCPGCHSTGLPALRRMVEGLGDRPEVVFLAVQTVFEGFETNTYEAMLKFQAESGLQIPFGHDAGPDKEENADERVSNILQLYRSGGTPWFIVIDPLDRVVFNDFRINADGAIEAIRHAIDLAA